MDFSFWHQQKEVTKTHACYAGVYGTVPGGWGGFVKDRQDHHLSSHQFSSLPKGMVTHMYVRVVLICCFVDAYVVIFLGDMRCRCVYVSVSDIDEYIGILHARPQGVWKPH